MNEIKEMGKLKQWWERIKASYKYSQPALVWPGDEIDVTITIKIFSQEDINTLFEVERGLRKLGFSFDTGYGGNGRDWEWDWSLKGPVSIKFRDIRRKPRPLYGQSNETSVKMEASLIKGNLIPSDNIPKI